MSEYEPQNTHLSDEQISMERNRSVWIAAIIAFTIVTLACIAACTITTYAFLVNAPW
jgi:flagellar basal body-associated protein FliL